MTGIIFRLLIDLILISRFVVRLFVGILDWTADLIYDTAITFQEAHLQPGDTEN